MELASLKHDEQIALLLRFDIGERMAMTPIAFCIESREPNTPRLPQRWQAAVAKAVTAIFEQLAVDERRDGHDGRALSILCGRGDSGLRVCLLRHDAFAQRHQRAPRRRA